MKTLLELLFSVTALLLSTVAVAVNSEELIQSKEDFLEFAANVSNGNNFEGITVLLKCNVDLKDETFAPIGNADSNIGFAGTFDGQGHVISNIVIEETTHPYAGLFRTLEEGGIVRNVVLDGSCSIKSTVAPTTADAADVYVGGIVGSVIGGASVEDCVSVARVEYNCAFSDAASGNAHVGGIAGSINGGSTSNLAEIMRCANYGSVEVGVLPSNVAAHLSGVVGTMGSMSAVRSSMNSGSIACSSSATATSYVGGLVGSVIGTSDVAVEDSVSNGAITATATGSNVGAIAGNVGSCVFNDNYFSNDLSVSDATGATSYDGITDVPSALGTGNWSVVTLRYNGAAKLVAGEDKSTLACADDSSKTCNTQLVAFGHLPPLTEEGGLAFAGWFTNESIVELVDPSTLGESSTVYAGFGYWLTVWNFETEETWTRLMRQVNEVFSLGIDLDDLGYDDCLTVKWSGVNADKVVRAGTPREDAYVMPACDAEMWTYIGNITYTVTLKYSLKCGDDSNKTIDTMVLDCGANFATSMVQMGDRNGQKFSAWTLDEECTLRIPALTTVKQDLNAFACWEDKVYALRFIFNNGTEDEVRLLYCGDEIDYPKEPVREEHVFIEWDSIFMFMPAHDLNITAQWHKNDFFPVTVVFNTGEGETLMNVTHNRTYGELPTPTRTGYTFVRWFTEDNETITSETIVDASKKHVLYAEWVINNYTLRFVFENGTEVDVRVFDFNSYVEYPDDPVMEGYTFKKWSENITAMPASNLTITALWTINNYTLRFIFNNGAEDEVRILNYNDEIVYPADPVKDGYTFDEWDSNITQMPAHDVNITAQWATFIVTIVFSKKNIGNVNVTEKIIEIASINNLVIESIVKYEEDDTIRYIVKFVDRKNGEDAITNFVENIAADESLKSAISQIYINGEKTVSDDDGDVTLIIIIVVVVVVIIVVLLAGLGLFVIWRKKSIEDARKQRGAHNRIVGQKVETVDASKFKSRFKNKRKIYPKDYTPPEGIYAALVSTGLDEVFAEEAASMCSDTAKNSGNKGYLTGKFTVCDAAAVCLYTFDFGGSNYEMNPYVLLNRALRAEKKKEDEIVKVRDVLYLVMSALRKLPVVKGVTLYRGIRSKVSMDEYKEGKVVVWPGFSSTSPDMNTTKAFLENTTRNDREKKERDRTGGIELSETPEGESIYGEGEETSGGTLFIIEDGWGYNVQPYSFFPDEEEILIEPEREFDVVSVMDSEGLVLITLKMRNTKKILPDIFGNGHK